MKAVFLGEELGVELDDAAVKRLGQSLLEHGGFDVTVNIDKGVLPPGSVCDVEVAVLTSKNDTSARIAIRLTPVRS